jgi:hypothetical protein
MIHEMMTLPPSLWEGAVLTTARHVAAGSQPSLMIVEGRDFAVPAYIRTLTHEASGPYLIERLWMQPATFASGVDQLVPIGVKLYDTRNEMCKGYLFVNGINEILRAMGFRTGVVSPTQLIVQRIQDAVRDGLLPFHTKFQFERYQHFYNFMGKLAPVDSMMLDMMYELYYSEVTFFEHEYYSYLEGFTDSAGDYPVPTPCGLGSIDELTRELIVTLDSPKTLLQRHTAMGCQRYTIPHTEVPDTLIAASYHTHDYRQLDITAWCDVYQWVFTVALSTTIQYAYVHVRSGLPHIDTTTLVTKHPSRQPPHLPNMITFDPSIAAVEFTLYPTYECMIKLHLHSGETIIKYMDVTWYAMACYSVANDL